MNRGEPMLDRCVFVHPSPWLPAPQHNLWIRNAAQKNTNESTLHGKKQIIRKNNTQKIHKRTNSPTGRNPNNK